MYTDAEGGARWTRPGKDTGVSATTNYMDSDLFYIFTTSTEFEPGRGYDKFGVYALLHHDNDFEAAARALGGGSEAPSGLTRGVLTNPSLSSQPVSTNPSLFVPQPLAAASPVPPSVTGTLLPGSGRRSDYTFDAAAPEGHIVAQFQRYCASVTDAAGEYTEAAALAILAVLTSGQRIQLAHIPEGLRTNLYLCLTGPSSLSRKSTVQQIALSFLKSCRPNSVLADRFTGEAAITDLGQKQVAIWVPDELGESISDIYATSFMNSLGALLLTLYSGQTYTYTTAGGGAHTIDGIDLSILGAATPESFASISARAIGSGLLPRFGLVFPDALPPSRPPRAAAEGITAARDAVARRLWAVRDMCDLPGAQRAVAIHPDALRLLGSMDAEYGARSMTSRLVTAAYKVSALLALGDLRHEISEADAQAAITITRRWADGVTHLRRFLGRPAADIALMETVDTVRTELKLLGAEFPEENGRRVIPLRFVARHLRMPASSLRRVRDTLDSTGEVVVVASEGEEIWHCAF